MNSNVSRIGRMELGQNSSEYFSADTLMMSKTLVQDLKYSDILKIGDAIEKCPYGTNWESFSRELGVVIGLPYHQIEFMEHGYFEEHSPCWGFLENLKLRKPDCSTSVLQQIALKFKRMDVYYFLDKVDNTTIQDMSTNDHKELVYYLQKIATTDWRMFADELGYSAHEIGLFERPSRWERPSVLLFGKLIKEFPNLTLKNISLAWKKVGRDNVSTVIDNLAIG